MTEKVALNRLFCRNEIIECKRAKTTNLRNMLYTLAALVDVNNSLEMRYVFVPIIIERILNYWYWIDKKEFIPQRYLFDREYARSNCIELI